MVCSFPYRVASGKKNIILCGKILASTEMRWFWGPVPPWGVCIADRLGNPLSAWKTKQSLSALGPCGEQALCPYEVSESISHLHPARRCPRMLQWRGGWTHLKPRGLGSGTGFLADLTGGRHGPASLRAAVVGSSPCYLDHWSCHLLCLWVIYFLFNFIKYVFYTFNNYLFLAAPGLPCCVQASSSCTQGLLSSFGVWATLQFRGVGFSLWELLMLWRTGSGACGLQYLWHRGLVALWHVVIFLDQGLNLCPLQWQANS